MATVLGASRRRRYTTSKMTAMTRRRVADNLGSFEPLRTIGGHGLGDVGETDGLIFDILGLGRGGHCGGDRRGSLLRRGKRREDDGNKHQRTMYLLIFLFQLEAGLGIEDFGYTNAEVVVHDEDFAASDKALVYEDVNGVTGEFVEFDDGTLLESEDIVNGHTGAAEFDFDFEVDVHEHVHAARRPFSASGLEVG